MDRRRNRNWINAQTAYQISRNYSQYSSIQLHNARNTRKINVQPLEESENRFSRNRFHNVEEERAGNERGETGNKESVLKQFCKETSFHGFNYLGEDNRSNLERIFWLVVLTFFYYQSVQLLIKGYEMFSTRTVIINIDGSPPLVSDIPFPAITICSSNQNTKSGLAKVDNNTLFREYKDDILAQLCRAYRISEPPDEKSRNFIDSSIITKFIQEVGSMNCSNVIKEQLWLLSKKNPCNNIQQIVTVFGICHTFNLLPLHQLYTDSFYHDHFKQQLNITTDASLSNGEGLAWTPEEGYKKPATNEYSDNEETEDEHEEVPYRTTGVSFVHSLFIHADVQDQDFTTACNRGSRGFFIIAHNPAELPGLSHPIRFVSADRISLLKVKTITHKLDKRLISWKPNERKCYLEKERPLRYFRFYTEENCRMECQANFTFLLCGCVPFHMPHLKTTPVCGPAKESCFKTLWTKVSPVQANKFCKCLPSCTELSYGIDFANSEKNRSSSITNEADNLGKGTTRFQIFYKDKVVSSYRRLLLADWNDGIALVGGLLCLFCGGSVLSFFELINFFIFRVIRPKNVENRNHAEHKLMVEKY